MKKMMLVCAGCCGWVITGLCAALPGAQLVLVADGMRPAPIVVFQDAPPFTRQAAEELAEYIEKTSGARPELIEGCPDPIPARAIWVGYQPVLNKLFLEINFEFQHPEEILIAANADHLVIAGRDRWNPEHTAVQGRKKIVQGVQQEYGTANAVYTFLQDYLGVRWLWPGELGEDIVESPTIAVAHGEYRYHPTIRGRASFLVFSTLLQNSGYGISRDWSRRQRLQLDSMDVYMGHAFKYWWERFHETHPEFFALQPDGTRSGFPGAHVAKICQSNPAVWKQWLQDVEAQLKGNPNMTVFNAAPNDGYNQGNCVCDDCRAWDSPDAALRQFIWAGLVEPHPALSDREVTFINHLGRLLKERYPDRDYYVSTLAYGHTRPAPQKAVPADNVVIVNAANMFWGLKAKDKDSLEEEPYAKHYADWGRLTRNHVWRPNTGNPAGWQNGLPDVPFARTMESFKFAVENNCIGIGVDSVWEQWANQGLLYYLMAQMIWNPAQDWRSVMDDYCRRGFGPAVGEIKSYWLLLEEVRNRLVDEFSSSKDHYAEVYDQSFFDRAYGLLDRAAAQVSGGPDKYGQRIDFIRVGLDANKLMAELRLLGDVMLGDDAAGAAAAGRARVLWEKLEALARDNPIALSWGPLRPNKRMSSGGLYHPDHAKSLVKAAPTYIRAADGATLEAAEQAGWDLVFHDDFERDELGDDWQVVEGVWTVSDGALRGAGTLASARGFPADGAPAYLRMEYEAHTDVQPSAEGVPVAVSDLSAVLQGKTDDPDQPDFLKTGYFFQFGWKMNRRTRISKAGFPVVSDNAPETVIEPDKIHKIVVENDHGHLRMFVDSNLVIDSQENQSILGGGHDRVGLYFFTAAKVSNVKVYVKRLTGGLDLE
ncbi:MAG: DUF4838 domain-containing protein [Kiritimatiellia bacterium]|nr:DUF4838 domain-containing protein [Lentisphaerota bacterium]